MVKDESQEGGGGVGKGQGESGGLRGEVKACGSDEASRAAPPLQAPDRQHTHTHEEESHVLMGLLQLRRQHHEQQQQQQQLLLLSQGGARPGSGQPQAANLLPLKRPLPRSHTDTAAGEGGGGGQWGMGGRPPPFRGPASLATGGGNGAGGGTGDGLPFSMSAQSLLARIRSLNSSQAAPSGSPVGPSVVDGGGRREEAGGVTSSRSLAEEEAARRGLLLAASNSRGAPWHSNAAQQGPSHLGGASLGQGVGLDFTGGVGMAQQHQQQAAQQQQQQQQQHALYLEALRRQQHHPMPHPMQDSEDHYMQQQQQQQQQRLFMYQQPPPPGRPFAPQASSPQILSPPPSISGGTPLLHHSTQDDAGVHRGGASLAESSDGGDEEGDEDMGSPAVRLGTGSSNASAASGTGDDCGSGMFAGQQGEQGPGGGGGKGGSGKGGKSVRVKNLDKVPQDVIRALDQQMAHMPPWDTRITREKLLQLGGVIMGDSSPVLRSGERSEHVSNYAPRNFHIKCQSCNKAFNGKNALRNFELHAIFWLLYQAHPALRLPAALADPEVEKLHRGVYPCNSISRDVIVFMEAKKPVLCNNQKKIWELQGDLHHDTSLFLGRAWVQIPPDRAWDNYKIADPTSIERVVCCRSGKTLEQYDTLRSHVFTWHDSGVFTACSHCGRVYQNTRTFLAHGCVKKGYDKDEMLIASCAQHMLSLLDSSPDFATLYYQMAKLDANKKEQVFDSVGKRLRANTS